MRFSSVNGLETPFKLLHPDAPPIALRGRTYVDDRMRDELKENRNSSYKTGRDIAGYELELAIKGGTLAKMLDAFANQIGRALTVFDFGCGDAKALSEISQLPCCADATGITVHPGAAAVTERGKLHVRAQNAVFVAPHCDSDGIVERCDTLLSVFGAARYHPLNQYYSTDEIDRLFGLLHGLNFLQEGGLFLHTPERDDQDIKQLVKDRIITQNHPYVSDYLGNSFNCNHYGVFQLLRRPTVDDIFRLLRDNCHRSYQEQYYSIQYTGWR